MGKTKAGVNCCAYCGATGQTERDHVIPKALFARPLPSDMVTVSACRPCNKKKSEDEEYLRDYLVLDPASHGSPEARSLLEGQVKRSVGTGRSELFRQFLRDARVDDLRTKGGLIYAPNLLSVPIDGQRMIRAFSRIVQGLHFHKFGTRLPTTLRYEAARVLPPEVRPFFKGHDANREKFNGPHVIGSTFMCWEMHASEDPLITHWLLLFFNAIPIIVDTEPRLGLGHAQLCS